MTKKKTKKEQKKPANSAPTPAETIKKEKEDELDMLEDIKRDEDLYISESDVTNISNFIRTTNKSFNSLGNLVVEKFAGRCSLAILHALFALFDTDSTEKEDVVRRLNIIYIVWRLPEMEAELRQKPQKNMSDVYSHPFATFLFYAEQIEHPVEATLARIIVTNNVGVIEKMTAPDFIGKAEQLNTYQVDREAWEKYEVANTDHWPEITEECVPVPKIMRDRGCERKDYEAGMAEAFYPLIHKAPTELPPKMAPLDDEDKMIVKHCKVREEQFPERAHNVEFSLSAGADMQEKLKSAFEDLGKDMEDYQDKIFSEMTQSEKDDATNLVDLGDDWIASTDSEVYSESEASFDGQHPDDSLADMYDHARDMAKYDMSDETLNSCIEKIGNGQTLTTTKTECMVHHIATTSLTSESFQNLVKCTETDEGIITMIKTNPRFATAFLSRNACCELESTHLFERYMKICAKVDTLVNALQVVLKLAQCFYERRRLHGEPKECLLNFVRSCIQTCEDSPNPSHRNIRLVAMLIRKLLVEGIILLEEVSAEVKPFVLRHSENRECTSLFKMITGQQSSSSDSDDGGQVTTTTTTTTSVAPNATQTTTTTTVVKQCGPAVIKQTSRKVVVQATSLKSSFQALNNLRKQHTAMYMKSSSGCSSPTCSHQGHPALPAPENAESAGAGEEVKPEEKPSGEADEQKKQEEEKKEEESPKK